MTLLRRDALILLGGMLAAESARAAGQEPIRAGAFAFDKPGGGSLPLSDLADKPILVVNTATRCGFAGQFVGLQGLWTRYGDRGLTVIAVPSPDFGDQEPLDGTAIADAARENHGVTFPVVDKTHVKGIAAHPFYRWAAEQRPADVPKWNFHKYLIGRDGSLRAAFSTATDPTDPRVISAIAAELPPA